jgi:hypothetical protein
MAVPSEYYPTGTFEEWATLVEPFLMPQTAIPSDDSQWLEWANSICVFSNFGSDGALVNDQIPSALNQATWQSWADAVIAKMNEVYP